MKRLTNLSKRQTGKIKGKQNKKSVQYENKQAVSNSFHLRKQSSLRNRH